MYSKRPRIWYDELVKPVKKKAVKLMIRKEDSIYVQKKKGCECDFCGKDGAEVFESDYEGSNKEGRSHGLVDVQICYECVTQLYKLIK